MRIHPCKCLVNRPRVFFLIKVNASQLPTFGEGNRIRSITLTNNISVPTCQSCPKFWVGEFKGIRNRALSRKPYSRGNKMVDVQKSKCLSIKTSSFVNTPKFMIRMHAYPSDTLGEWCRNKRMMFAQIGPCKYFLYFFVWFL